MILKRQKKKKPPYRPPSSLDRPASRPARSNLPSDFRFSYTESPVVFIAESEPKEWVAQVEPGVLITFVSLPLGGNDLKRIRFRYPVGDGDVRDAGGGICNNDNGGVFDGDNGVYNTGRDGDSRDGANGERENAGRDGNEGGYDEHVADGNDGDDRDNGYGKLKSDREHGGDDG